MNSPTSTPLIAGPRTAPLFFGSADEPLFGHYGPPQGSSDRDHAVLLCAPVGNDYIRTHWRLRLLGDRLMREGYHVFRFDFSCLGDSWGEFEQATLPRWLEDVRAARTELDDNAAAPRLSIVGHRLGATLAYFAASDMSVDHLVLWDPIVDGAAHLAELRKMQQSINPTTTTAPFESLLGYRYRADLIDDLGRLDLLSAPRPSAKRISFLCAGDDPACRRLYDKLPGAQWAACESTAWAETATFADALPLGDAGNRVVELLEGGGA